MHSDSYWSDEQAQRRAERFGHLMHAWRVRCGWTQYELPRWGKAAGFVSPSTGTMGQLERGVAKNPHMRLFAGLAEANRRLAEQDFTGVQDRKLLERLRSGVPVLDAAGEPWSFPQFVEAYHLPHQVSGEIWDASGSSSTPRPELTAEELQRVNDALAEGFLELARQIKPITKALLQAVRVAPPAERIAYEAALSGDGYDVETLGRLWDQQAGQWAPLVWLKQLQGPSS